MPGINALLAELEQTSGTTDKKAVLKRAVRITHAQNR